MTAYNVAGASSMQAGVAEDVSQVLANFNLIATVLNGNIDNANISPTAAILLSKLAGYPTDATKIPDGGGNWRVPTAFTSGLTINAANTDLAFPAAIGNAAVGVAVINTGGGTLRSLGAGAFIGQIITLKSHFSAVAGFTIKGSLAGGTGAQFRNGNGGAVDIVLGVGDSATFVWDGALWWEIDRDISGGVITYRKTTVKTVNTTVAATDLLNGEITIAANAMGASGRLRLTAEGDMLNNSGGLVSFPRLQLIFGGTTVFDTNASGAQWGSGATRQPWKLNVEIANLSAANAQSASFMLLMNGSISGSFSVVFTTGTGNLASSVGGGGVWPVFGSGVNSGLAIDTTAAKTLVLNVINGSASATYETKLFDALVEVI